MLITGLHPPVFAQSKYWRGVKGKPLVKFDWNCTLPSAYPKAKLERLVNATLRREGVEAGAQGDRAFVFDLNGDRKPEYFVPLVCGATGNCTWGIFALNPSKLLGVIGGQYIYAHVRVGGWPDLITYSHMSAAEGALDTWTFKKGRYIGLRGTYAIGYNSPTDILGLPGHKMPKFLDRARAGCETLGN